MANPVAIKPFNEVQIGDKVAVSGRNRLGGRSVPYAILTIERLTATQAISKHGRRFRLADGMEIGGRNRYDRPVVVGPEFVAQMAAVENDIQREISARNWLYGKSKEYQRIPVGAIEAMQAAFDAWIAANPKQEQQ